MKKLFKVKYRKRKQLHRPLRLYQLINALSIFILSLNFLFVSSLPSTFLSLLPSLPLSSPHTPLFHISSSAPTQPIRAWPRGVQVWICVCLCGEASETVDSQNKRVVANSQCSDPEATSTLNQIKHLTSCSTRTNGSYLTDLIFNLVYLIWKFQRFYLTQNLCCGLKRHTEALKTNTFTVF